MENHPIPQDVTGFKFKLVGSITVKQFAYLLAGGILATVVFILPFQSAALGFIIKMPFMAFFGLLGAALAFIPIEGRPLDKMIISFLKTVPSENQYLYHKRGVAIQSLEYFKPPIVKKEEKPEVIKRDKETIDKKAMLLKQLGGSQFKPDESELAFMNTIKGFFKDQVASTTFADPAQPWPAATANQPGMTPPPSQTDLAKPVLMTDQAKDVDKLQKELSAIREEIRLHGSTQELEKKIVELQKELQEALSQKEELVKKVYTLQNQTSSKQAPLPVPAVPVKSQLLAGFPSIPDVPNIILGIVKDPRGKVLPNILVEVMDINETPVRAFKTNQLGQFMAATPLPTGTYQIHFDDPSKLNEFDTIKITLKSEIFQPLEIISMDQRERLRKELFGADTAQVH